MVVGSGDRWGDEVSETEELTRGTPDACRRCGEPAGSFRFCMSCGADLLAKETDPDVAKASRLSRELRRIAPWRTPLVVFPLLAALAVVGGMGARMLTQEIPPPEPQTQVLCWDGTVTESASGCTAPSGVDGLRWVFPTFHPDRDDCVDVLIEHPEYPRPAMFECDFKAGNRWLKVTYNELASVEAARKYYEKEFPDADREQVRTAEGTPYRYLWRQQTDAGFELAAMYIDFPYAVEVVAKTASSRDLALRKLGFRHPDKMSVADEDS